GADIAGEHGLDGRLELRGGADGDGPLGPQDTDRIFHQAAFDAVGSDGAVEWCQVLQAIAALFVAGQVDVAAGWTDHGAGPSDSPLPAGERGRGRGKPF